jgi:hypothetical protein
MTRDHTATLVARIPPCDMDAEHGPALVDGRTGFGPWAFMCAACFAKYGVGLGLGQGQRLVLRQARDGARP